MAVLILGACGTDESAAESSPAKAESENGPVEVPKDPQRVISLTNGPNALALDANIVGIDEWTNANPLFQDQLEGVEVVSEDNLEKIIELGPI